MVRLLDNGFSNKNDTVATVYNYDKERINLPLPLIRIENEIR